MTQLQAKAQAIAREIHGMKGEASALKLSTLVSQAEQFEDKVKSLQAKSNLTGKDFLSAVVNLEAMITTVTQAQDWHGKMRPASPTTNQTKATLSTQNTKPQSVLTTFFADFVQDIAKRH